MQIRRGISASRPPSPPTLHVHVGFLFPEVRGGPVLFLVYTLFYYLKLVTEISDHKSPVNPRMGTLENWLRDDFHPQVPDVQIRIVRVIIISA